MSSSDLFCPSVSGHGSSSRLYLSTFYRLSQGTANPYRVTLMVRPLLWQNPVRVTRPVPSGRLPFSSASCAFRRVGLPVSSHSVGRRPFGLRRTFPIYRSSSFVSGLATFFVRFRSPDFLRSFPVFQPSPFASNPVDLFRPFPVLRPSPFFLRFQPFGW